jgi:NAD-dependent deacetylase
MRRLLRATATGYGQILFCESPAAGALLLGATALATPRAALMAAVACLVATTVAWRLGYPARDWTRGLYGYAAALLGLFVGALLADTPWTWLALLAAAGLAPATTRLAHRLLTPREIPALALPALGLAWLLVLGLGVDLPPTSSRPWLVAAASVTAAIGLAVYSRLAVAAALPGLAVGLVVANATGQSTEAVLANSVPTAIALGAVFVPWSAASAALSTLAAAAAGAAAAGSVALGVPTLVAPFNVVVVVTLLLLRMPAVRRRVPGRPWVVPLPAVSRPESALAHWKARARLASLVSAARAICVLSGAGVSTAAGLPDFRGPLGARGRRITLAEFVAAADVRREYWEEEERFLRLVHRAAPAPVHRTLADLYRGGRLSAVVTQNVDGLHQAAGVPEEAVIEIHGNMRTARCLDCRRTVPRAELSGRIAAGDFNLYCPDCQGLLKGGSVMFGERLDPRDLDRALRALLASDLLVVLGTSLLVSPARDMLGWAREGGIPVAIVNAGPTPYDRQADLAVVGDVGPALEDAVRPGPPVR